MEIPRLHAPLIEEFVEKHLRPGRPALISGAMIQWRLDQRWTPAALCERLNSEQVALFNDYFDFRRFMPLSRYVDTFFGCESPPARIPYVRWYSKMRSVNFPWADPVFARLQDRWQRPAFLPESGYLLPKAAEDQIVDPVSDRFPARGLFISGRGGRTGLHIDPWGSDAVLCAAYGVKSWTFYDQEQADYLVDPDGVCDVDQPDLDRFPKAHLARPTYAFKQQPGEIVYVPRGWLHAVRNETDTIAVTWNFVHRDGAATHVEWCRKPMSDLDRDVLNYFTSGASFEA